MRRICVLFLWLLLSAAALASTSSSKVLSLTIAAGPGLPVPPNNAIVFRDIDQTDNSTWDWCNDCAGAGSIVSDYWTQKGVTSPSRDGLSRQFHLGAGAWGGALWWHKVSSFPGQFDYASHYLTDYWYYVDPASQTYVHTLEYDFYTVLGGYEYMIGSHCSFGDGYWYGWSQDPNYWVKTDVPCNTAVLPAGQWHHVQWYMERLPGTTTYRYDSLVVDGVAHTLNLVEPAGPINWSNVTGVQWQIDSNGKNGPVNLWIDQATFTVW